MEIGMGQRPVEDMQTILDACDRSKAGPTAEPQGLTLIKIKINDLPD